MISNKLDNHNKSKTVNKNLKEKEWQKDFVQSRKNRRRGAQTPNLAPTPSQNMQMKSKFLAQPLGTVNPENRQRNTVQLIPSPPPTYDRLGPQAQFELTALRPGEFQTPYVENNGVASRLSTMIINGQSSFTVSAAEAAKYTLLSICPIAAASDASGVGSTGIGYLSGLNDTSTFTMADVRGGGFSTYYGASTFASRITPYATRLMLKLLAPEATISGVAYLGSMPISSYIGSTISTLIKNSTSTIDLKSFKDFEIKASVSSRGLIHHRTSTSLTVPQDFGDEWVSYALIDKGAVMSFSDGTSVQHVWSITAHTNAVWWPSVDTPALSGAVQKVVPSVQAENTAQEVFKKIAETYLSAPQPFTLDNLKKIVPQLLTAAKAIPSLGPWISAAHGVASLALTGLTDPRDKLPDFVNIIADLDWIQRTIDSKYTFPEPIQDRLEKWFDATENLRQYFEKMQENVSAIKTKYKTLQRITSVRGGHLTARYIDEDGFDYSHDEMSYVPPDPPRSGSKDSSFKTISRRLD